MNDYITRKSEIYARAQQGMLRVLKSHGKDASGSTTSWTRPTTRNYEWYDPWSRYHGHGTGSQGSGHGEDEEAPGADGQDQEERNDSDAGQDEEWQSVRSWRWSNSAWNWRGSSQSEWWSNSQRTTSWETPQVAAWKEEAPSFFLTSSRAGIFLQDANLETAERNMIVSSLKHDFTYDCVAQELRAQWSDEDLKRKDMQTRGSGWWVDETPDDREDEGEGLAWLAQAPKDFNDEGLLWPW